MTAARGTNGDAQFMRDGYPVVVSPKDETHEIQSVEEWLE